MISLVSDGTLVRSVTSVTIIDYIFDCLQCNFRILAETPIPLFRGGSEITILAGQPYVIDARPSIDTSVPPGTPPTLEYKMTCKVIAPAGASSSMCKMFDMSPVSGECFSYKYVGIGTDNYNDYQNFEITRETVQ